MANIFLVNETTNSTFENGFLVKKTVTETYSSGEQYTYELFPHIQHDRLPYPDIKKGGTPNVRWKKVNGNRIARSG